MVHDLFWAISDLGIECSSVMRVIDGSSISDSFLEIMMVHLFRWACVLIVLKLSKAERKVAVSISSQLFIDSTSVVTRWFDGLLLFVEAESASVKVEVLIQRFISKHAGREQLVGSKFVVLGRGSSDESSYGE